MAAYTMNGIVKVVMNEQSFASGFTKREFVVTSKDEKYPQDIKFEAAQEKTAILDGVSAGDDVTVTFDLRGNEYKDKYYVNLRAWKLEKGQGAGVPADLDDDKPPLPLDVPEDVVGDDDGVIPF